MIFKGTMIHSLYTPYSIYFRMVMYMCIQRCKYRYRYTYRHIGIRIVVVISISILAIVSAMNNILSLSVPILLLPVFQSLWAGF